MYGYNSSHCGRGTERKPSPDFEADPMAGWPSTSIKDPNLHPSQAGRRRFEDGPYEAAAKKRTWQIPKQAHPLSRLLAQLARPKFCSSERWIEDTGAYQFGRSLSSPKLEHVKLFSAEDGTPLGTIRSLDLDAVRKLAKASPFGMGSQTLYDEAVHRGLEVRGAQLQLGLVRPLSPPTVWQPIGRGGAWYFSDVAFQVGRFLFPGARAVKLVLYKLAIYSPGGHFKMHKDTTHADSHAGTVLIGCGVAQDDDPQGDEDWELMDYDLSQKVEKDAYSGGDLVILDDDGKEQRYHIRPGQVLAFCTDVPHAVDIVTSGVKLTLQFDVYLEDESVSRDNTVACVDLADWDAFYARPRVAETETETIEDDEPLEPTALPSPPLACSSCNHTDCVASDKQVQDAVSSLENDPDHYWDYPGHAEHFNSYGDDVQRHWRFEESAFGRYPIEALSGNVDRFVAHVVALLRKAPPTPGPDESAYTAPRTVAFLLSHMYRKRSICPEYLKTVDAAVYRALVASEKLRVILHHVTYRVDWSESGVHDQYLAICPPYKPGFSLRDIAEPVLCPHRPGAGSMYLRTEQAEMIARGEIYVGNEAFEEPAWYVAGAVFVSLL